MVSVLFALLTALCNGLASVLQRIAASTAPPDRALHLSLFSYLIKRKVWLAGIGLVILAAVCQAIALATGPIALVQPIFIIELPFTLLVASQAGAPRAAAADLVGRGPGHGQSRCRAGGRGALGRHHPGSARGMDHRADRHRLFRGRRDHRGGADAG